MKSTPYDPIRLGMVPRDQAITHAMRALHPVQNQSPEEMVAAIAVLFYTVTNRVGIDPQVAHALGKRLVVHHAHHDKSNKLLQSLRDFAGLRIKGEEVVIS